LCVRGRKKKLYFPVESNFALNRRQVWDWSGGMVGEGTVCM
jgi:hypothetical protein